MSMPDSGSGPDVRITANLLGVPFGFAGLALVWRAGRTDGSGVPGWPTEVFSGVTVAVLVLLTLAWLRQLRRSPVRDELGDAVLAPFFSLAPTVVVLVGAGLSSDGVGAGRWVVVGGVIGVVALAAWITSGWIIEEVPLEAMNPGWFLPTVAGGLISGSGFAAAGWHRAAIAAYAVGLVYLVVLGAVVLVRFLLAPALPERLTPTLFIMASPAAVAGNAWFVISGGRLDAMQLALGGNTVLLVLLQVRFLPLYRRMPFAASFWSFSFSSAALATYAVHWLRLGDVPGRAVLVWVVLAVITSFYAWLVVRSAVLLRAGTFLPRWPAVRREAVGQ